MMFIVRGGEWIPMKGMSFREFIRKGKDGHRATRADFELHLSTAFPEARLKHYLEIRGMDAQRFPLIPCVAAFWKGVLYDAEIRAKAWELVRHASAKEVLALHHEVPRLGLRARLGKVPVLEIARQLYRLSCQGLGNQASPDRPSECVFLDRMDEEILKPGRPPAETLLEKWNGEFGQNPQRLIQYLEI